MFINTDSSKLDMAFKTDRQRKAAFAKKKVSFWATKVEKVPTRVRFTTWDGKRVSFVATKAVAYPKKVSFYKRRKR